MTDRRFVGRRVLVTGGAGFIGSQLVARLLAEEASVVVLDDLFTGRPECLGSHPRLQLVIGSVTDQSLVHDLVAQVDLVFHLAARNIIVSIEDPRSDFETNIGGTLNVLLAVRDHLATVERMVYTSSASVYGNPRYLPINEDDRINILSPYAASKVAGEHYCRAFAEMYAVPTVVLRYSNVYGVGQSPSNPYCGVIARFMAAAEEGRPLTIHGDGQQTRDFTYISDVVEATMLAGLIREADNLVFNVGTGIETSVLQLAAEINRIYEGELDAVHIDRRDVDNVRRRVVNIELARSRLRWIPNVPLSHGVELTVQWIRQSAASQTEMESGLQAGARES